MSYHMRITKDLHVLSQVKLDNGCIIFGSARKLYLQMFDPIHNQGLRLALNLELLLLLVYML